MPVEIPTTDRATTFADESLGLARANQKIRERASTVWLDMHHPSQRTPRLAREKAEDGFRREISIAIHTFSSNRRRGTVLRIAGGMSALVYTLCG